MPLAFFFFRANVNIYSLCTSHLYPGQYGTEDSRDIAELKCRDNIEALSLIVGAVTEKCQGLKFSPVIGHMNLN